MDQKVEPPPDTSDPYRLLWTANRLARLNLKLIEKALKTPNPVDVIDPLRVGEAFAELGQRLMSDPVKLAGAQLSLWSNYVTLYQRMWWRMLGFETRPLIEPEREDRRFKDEAWDDNAVFDAIKQAYLVTGRWVLDTIRGVDGVDPATVRKLEFYSQQVLDALAPTNFAATNPAVLRTTLETGGRNLLDGLARLVEDLERSDGRFSPVMTDLDAFEVGVNLAVTPGKVVFQNELMQLIQYEPATDTVARRPLLVVPPWMNKYYIMDLSPRNSMIKWLVEQGHTVFVISWVNPDPTLAGKRFEDYMHEGPLAALDAIEQATGERQVNAVGYCLGGILLTTTVAYLAEQEDDRIASATYFTTMVDFSDVGDISVFVDEAQLDYLERKMRGEGYLDGNSIADTFRSLRANDLVWSFFVNNYLLGKEPLPFDLLYWNSDSTGMPATMHLYFIRNMYLKNRLREPGGITLDGVPIDVRRVTTPAYILSTRDDHIAPWKTTYHTTGMMSGPVRFVLGASGHIAGVINHPAKEKYGYWTGADADYPAEPDTWLEQATPHKGSWWPDWHGWLGEYDGGRVPARQPGDGALAPIEDAPGSYVKRRLDEC